jgi:hypothetical protein
MPKVKLNYKLLLSFCLLLVLITNARATEVQNNQANRLFPFGLSNPYEGKESSIKARLPTIIKDLGLNEQDGERGYVIDNISRTRAESINDKNTPQYDFDSQVGTLIDLVVRKGDADLWIVLNPVTRHKFSDGQERKDKRSYLASGQNSRAAWRKYLTALIEYLNKEGRKASHDENWVVRRYNLYNEVVVEYTQTFGKKNKAYIKAYADFVIDSAKIIRELSPGSEIVLGGAAGKFDLGKNSNDTPFYLALFDELSRRGQTGLIPFDTFESHWFPTFKGYQNNIMGYGVKDFINFLKNNGQQDKEFVIRAGGTYSGIDQNERKNLMDRYQTEHDQAELLIKRFVYNLAAGAKAIPWSTVYEQKAYQKNFHVIYNYIGLLYNGFPDGMTGDAPRKIWQPYPDPGEGVKKLSYFSFKKLVEKLRGSDWGTVVRINTEVKDVYVFKFSQTDKTVYVAWWDWWQTCDRSKSDEEGCLISAEYARHFDQLETCVNNCSKQCIAKEAPKVTLMLSNDAKDVIVTEAIPNQQTGQQASDKDYKDIFNSTKKTTSPDKRSLEFTLGSTPLYIEVTH